MDCVYTTKIAKEIIPVEIKCPALAIKITLS